MDAGVCGWVVGMMMVMEVVVCVFVYVQIVHGSDQREIGRLAKRTSAR